MNNDLSLLQRRLQQETNCNEQAIVYKRGNPDFLFLDEFSIEVEHDGFFLVSDATDSIDDFAGTEQHIVSFFRGFYDAYSIPEEDKEKNKEGYDIELYNRGYNFGIESMTEE